MILQANHFLEQVLGPAKLIGTTKDGQARVERNSVFRENGEIFRADHDEAARLIKIGAVRKPRLSGELAAIAEETLTSDSPLDAALAAIPLPRIRVWHAMRDGDYWVPAPVLQGPGRGGFSVRFGDSAEVRMHWAVNPAAVPLFTFATPHCFNRAFVWQLGGLIEIPTQINRIGGAI